MPRPFFADNVAEGSVIALRSKGRSCALAFGRVDVNLFEEIPAINRWATINWPYGPSSFAQDDTLEECRDSSSLTLLGMTKGDRNLLPRCCSGADSSHPSNRNTGACWGPRIPRRFAPRNEKRWTMLVATAQPEFVNDTIYSCLNATMGSTRTARA